MQKPGMRVKKKYLNIYAMRCRLTSGSSRIERLGGTGNQRPIIVKFLNFKTKEKIKSKIRQKLKADEYWVNPNRVADDFA